MIRFIGSLEVDHPPEVAFELLADMAELHKWNPNVTDSRRTAGDRLGQGSRYESTIARGPIRMTAHSKLVAVEASKKVTYKGSIGRFWSVDSLTFEPSGEGTLITFHNETESPLFLRPLAPLMNAAFQRQARKAVEGARRYLVGSTPDSGRAAAHTQPDMGGWVLAGFAFAAVLCTHGSGDPSPAHTCRTAPTLRDPKRSSAAAIADRYS
jgi:uncharacterized protein YndB with AHSA1/START domain